MLLFILSFLFTIIIVLNLANTSIDTYVYKLYIRNMVYYYIILIVKSQPRFNFNKINKYTNYEKASFQILYKLLVFLLISKK